MGHWKVKTKFVLFKNSQILLAAAPLHYLGSWQCVVKKLKRLHPIGYKEDYHNLLKEGATFVTFMIKSSKVLNVLLSRHVSLLGTGACAYCAVCLLWNMLAATWLSRIPECELVYLRHSQPTLTAAAALTAKSRSITYPSQRLAREQRGQAGFHFESPDISFISLITYKHKRGEGKELSGDRTSSAIEEDSKQLSWLVSFY